jgi:phage terminase small subunit
MDAVTPADLLPEGREKYAELHAALSASRPLSAFDLDLIRCYADAFALRTRAIAELRAGPLTVKGSNGNNYPNPASKSLDMANREMDRCLRRLKADVRGDDDAAGELDRFNAFVAERTG